MGRKVKHEDRIVQRSIGFRNIQIDFFDKFPDFKPDEFCRLAVDEQIKLIAPEFLKLEDEY